MRTAATDLFDIDLPLFAFSHCRDVVAAVTNAGGVGVLGAVAHSPERLETDLRWIEAEVRGRPRCTGYRLYPKAIFPAVKHCCTFSAEIHRPVPHA